MMTTKYKSLADALRHRIGWKRTDRGNLKRTVGEITVIVFARDESFGRCMFYEDEETEFIDDSWETEVEALEAANEWIQELEE